MPPREDQRRFRLILRLCTVIVAFLNCLQVHEQILLITGTEDMFAELNTMLSEVLMLFLEQINTASNVPDRPLSLPTLCFPAQYNRRREFDVFTHLQNEDYLFWLETGETVQSFTSILNDIRPQLQERRQGYQRANVFTLSDENCLLMCFKWLRTYPSYSSLAVQFNASRTTVSRTLRFVTQILWHYFRQQIRWPTRDQWLAMRGCWEEFPNAVGTIDGTLTQIYRPQTEPQHEFYSGNRHYHCMSTQIICDVYGNFVYVQSGFLGHLNDAAQFNLLPPIGPHLELDFPQNVCLLGDNGYANRWPILTRFKANERAPGVNPQDRRMFNSALSSKRTDIEHSISFFKTYRAVSEIYRHERWEMPVIADVCAFLAQRHIALSRQLRRA